MKSIKIMLLALLSCACSSKILFAESDPLVNGIDEINKRLVAEGSKVAIYSVELFGSGEGLNMGRTVIASDHGNKQLGTDWALNDPNRNFRTNITYAIDDVEVTADFSAAEQPDIVRFGFETWDKQKCSNIGIDEIPVSGFNIGYIGALLGGNDLLVPGYQFGIDIIHGGFKPNFDNVLICGVGNVVPGCGDGVLGVTYTLNWVINNPDGTTTDTDYDNNGKLDTALKETYYNDRFTWRNDGTDDPASGVYDFATVALHESGHALSRAHFGDVSIHHKKGLQTSPKAVMNAIYSGVQRKLKGPDKGGHCSDWGAWPNQN